MNKVSLWKRNMPAGSSNKCMMYAAPNVHFRMRKRRAEIVPWNVFYYVSVKLIYLAACTSLQYVC